MFFLLILLISLKDNIFSNEKYFEVEGWKMLKVEYFIGWFILGECGV